MRNLLAGMVTASLLAFAAPAQAAPTSFWFDCTGALPLQTYDVETYSWSATAPTKSYQEGAGCGWLDPPFTGTAQPNPIYDASYGGGYTGEVRKLEMTLYAPFVDGVSNKTIDLIITADGEEVANLADLAPAPAVPSSTGGTAAFTYTVSGLDLPAVTRGGRDYVISVAGNFLDDTPGFLHGAKEIPSNIKFFGFADLTPEEQEEILLAEEEEQAADAS